MGYSSETPFRMVEHRPSVLSLDGRARPCHGSGKDSLGDTQTERVSYGRMFYREFCPRVLFFAITGVCEGIGICGKHRDRCDDP